MKTAIVVGHTQQYSGAYNKETNVSEFMFNYLLAAKLQRKIPDSFIVLRDTYKDLPRKVNATKPDLIISLHCNAFNTEVSGTETLYCRGSIKGIAAALLFQKHVATALGLPNRGIKSVPRKGRGGLLLHETKAPCLILEPFFIDNDRDFSTACERETQLINAIVTATEEVYNVVL